MAIVNTSKPTTAIANSSRVSFAETWGAIQTTWASETRTWADAISLMDNTSILSDLLWSHRTYPWLLALPWQQSGITNSSKP